MRHVAPVTSGLFSKVSSLEQCRIKLTLVRDRKRAGLTCTDNIKKGNIYKVSTRNVYKTKQKKPNCLPVKSEDKENGWISWRRRKSSNQGHRKDLFSRGYRRFAKRACSLKEASESAIDASKGSSIQASQSSSAV